MAARYRSGVKVSVVSDVHGNIEALARVAERAERLVILGDLVDYVDYHDPEQGILGGVFGAEPVRQFIALRGAGRFTELRALNARLWGSVADPEGLLTGLIRDRYTRVLQVVPDDTVVTLGNVDVADHWEAVAGSRMPYQDGTTVDIDGVRFGFVAGGVFRRRRPPAIGAPPDPTHPWRPLMRSAEQFGQVLGRLPAVDVLCTHVPPDLVALRYDTVPARLEMFGPGLLEYIAEHHPPWALSGHVHQPLAPRVRVGLTECRNVGHFQRSERAVVIDLDSIPRRAVGVAAATSTR